ncbi:predicted protein [Histoplasma mississippiense (nom. inval.)]|uniref:predicted protein n=1 Tax=Ajellomyces capsulatus (strain NAm1 / WU24) TaxID=2059318 RepID=UPI000157BB2E|nr:predicted protein [Histoplasma mississippiense (nom. inval.)]EDN05813.1 predicted protein [Histoplasma mississippiense (nom. inval.)]
MQSIREQMTAAEATKKDEQIYPLLEDSDDITIPTDLMTACSLNLPPPKISRSGGGEMASVGWKRALGS